MGEAVALDVTFVSPLNLDIVQQAGLTCGLELGGLAAVRAEAKKHREGDAACALLGWKLVPLVANEYGVWGDEAVKFFRVLAERMGRQNDSGTSAARNALYWRLGVIVIARRTGRSLLRRSVYGAAVLGDEGGGWRGAAGD